MGLRGSKGIGDVDSREAKRIRAGKDGRPAEKPKSLRQLRKTEEKRKKKGRRFTTATMDRARLKASSINYMCNSAVSW